MADVKTFDDLTHAKVTAESSREEIEAEIKRLEKLSGDFNNIQMAVKIFINSVYGATGSPYFIGYNISIAEAITLQGQSVIKYASTIINRYFRDFWHKDKAVHAALKLKNPPEPFLKDASRYGDTDSVYVSFEDAWNGCDYKDQEGANAVDFILGIYETRLKEYLRVAFDKFATKDNTDNLQNFELEMIARSAIFLAKKKYVYDPIWKDPGIRIESLSKITAKGVEIVQSSTPLFAREKLKDLLKYLLDKKQNFKSSEFVMILKEIKDEFKLQEIDNIAQGSSIGDYEKFILDDVRSVKIGPHCPIHVRAAAYFNYDLNKSDWKGKYQLIKTGDRIKYYHTKPVGNRNVYAYLPGSHPHEFAPDIDYDMQFSKTMIEPINRFIKIMGHPPISPNLVTTSRLF